MPTNAKLSPFFIWSSIIIYKLFFGIMNNSNTITVWENNAREQGEGIKKAAKNAAFSMVLGTRLHQGNNFAFVGRLWSNANLLVHYLSVFNEQYTRNAGDTKLYR